MISCISISGVLFEVNHEADLTAYEDDGTPVPVQGCCCVASQQITLSKAQTPQMRLKTLLHEAVEAYNTLYDVRLTHQQINQMEMFVFNLIADNPEVNIAIEETT